MNNEVILQNRLIVKPDVIEEGLTLIERETRLKNGKKCDILFKDKENRKLYVEVKETINNKSIEQLSGYQKIVNCKDSRFMLVANNCVNDKYKDKLREQKLELKVINKDHIVIRLENVLDVIKGDAEFRSREGVFKALKEQGKIAIEIYNYVAIKLHSIETPIICNISDGIMFHPVNTNNKFLSITTKRNRLLFHFPNGNRDGIYLQFKRRIPELYYSGSGDKNQIDIKLSNIKCLENVKPLIDKAFISIF
ncbi:endonuclease NucS domain-containing protein [Bacillus cereus]|uniref:endonuclease NucS domain-containing protein n=1 Tax=Bacillus cereus TaxID=1396 RepID=UPI0024BD5395|nr:endonuclease NucS domain-containing protein [Bacillus cereus]